jgi:hypothetical protein
LAIDNKQSVRIAGTSDCCFNLLKILDLIGWNFNRHRASEIFYLRLSDEYSCMEIHRRNAAKQLHLTMVGRILIKGHEDFFPTCAGIDDGIMAESFVVRQSKAILARSCSTTAGS